LAPYQQNRLLAFLNPHEDPRATGWHVIQSKIAIGSGGFLGQGFTHGPQKRLAFLPAQFTDFIFSVVGEELGFLGVLVALALFGALIFILIRIARRATDPYSSLCVLRRRGWRRRKGPHRLSPSSPPYGANGLVQKRAQAAHVRTGKAGDSG
jgi:rod shape determining protein RodA